MNLPKSLAVPALLLIVLALTGCGPSPAQLTATVQTAKILTLTAAPTATPPPGPTSTPTPTATITPSPTPAQTPTTTSSPTPDWPIPGNYSMLRNATTPLNQGGKLTVYVSGITIEKNHHLVFSVMWIYWDNLRSYAFTKKSGRDNRNIYLIDNHGKRYDHIAGGGDAYKSVELGGAGMVPAKGWFDFGEAGEKSVTYDFYDNDNDVIIWGIALFPGDRRSLNVDFTLEPYPLRVQYSDDLWNIVESDDGVSKFVHKNIPACTLQAQAAHKPQGAFKNQIPVGAITYDIYGYFDETANFYVREYIYVSGLSGLDAKVKPFFYVTIPADNSDACILAASSLLSGLAPRQP